MSTIETRATRRLERLAANVLHRLSTIALATGLTFCFVSNLAGQTEQEFETQRLDMVKHAVLEAGVQNERVLQALRDTPRHLFVPRHLRPQAYLDMALPIGDQQTISSPFIVAFMTECLDPQPADRVLEIGTGSGYQAAVLSRLVDHVYSIEIVPELGHRAIRTLRLSQSRNVSVRIGDGFQGWPEHAPFDKIIVTCSPEKVPQALIDQLKEGGRLVIPVGERYQQTMYLFRKDRNELKQEALLPTVFVPMTGQAEKNRTVQPDPQHPVLVNSDFEADLDDQGFVSGWYYQRQATRMSGAGTPSGTHYLRLENKTLGQDAHLMQGMAIDGRTVRSLKIGCWIRTTGVPAGAKSNEGPRLTVSFYDKDRKELGVRWLGPWRGDQDWQQVVKSMPVPSDARELILRIGMFGATGTAEFDEVQLSVEN